MLKRSDLTYTLPSQADPTTGEPYAKEANLFVSHPWGMRFTTLLGALRNFLKKMKGKIQEPVYLWYDVVTVNQHLGTMLPQAWWARKPAGARILRV